MESDISARGEYWYIYLLDYGRANVSKPNLPPVMDPSTSASNPSARTNSTTNALEFATCTGCKIRATSRLFTGKCTLVNLCMIILVYRS